MGGGWEIREDNCIFAITIDRIPRAERQCLRSMSPVSGGLESDLRSNPALPTLLPTTISLETMTSILEPSIWRLSSRASGLLPNAPGLPVSEGWASELILSAVLGAFLGLVIAFIVSKVIRGIGAYDWLRFREGRLAFAASVSGALGFAAWSLISD